MDGSSREAADVQIKVHDSGPKRDDDRFTAHTGFRHDVGSVSVVELSLEAYGATDAEARQRLATAALALAKELTTEFSS